MEKKKPVEKASAEEKAGEETHLIYFYGQECQHSASMAPLVARLEKELKVKVLKLEVWHNEENAHLLEEYDQGSCNGVPFFYNEKTGEFLCGATDYESLKAWALGQGLGFSEGLSYVT